MPNNTNSTGLPPPTIQARNGNTPAEAAYNDRQQQNTSNAELARLVSGGSMKKKGGAITVPVLQTPYKTTGSPEQSPTGIAANNASVSSTSGEQAKYDNKLGGGKRGKKGGNPNWIWGCYSGGKKRKTQTNKRKTRRYRKKTRRNKK